VKPALYCFFSNQNYGWQAPLIDSESFVGCVSTFSLLQEKNASGVTTAARMILCLFIDLFFY
jgi:hypothetical protein